MRINLQDTKVYTGGQLAFTINNGGFQEDVRVIVTRVALEGGNSELLVVTGDCYRRHHGTLWVGSQRSGFLLRTSYQSGDVVEGTVVWYVHGEDKGKTEVPAKLYPRRHSSNIAVDKPRTTLEDALRKRKQFGPHVLIHEHYRKGTTHCVIAISSAQDAEPTPIVPFTHSLPSWWQNTMLTATVVNDRFVVDGVGEIQDSRTRRPVQRSVSGSGSTLMDAIKSLRLQ
jgi:hypothetical protein